MFNTPPDEPLRIPGARAILPEQLIKGCSPELCCLRFLGILGGKGLRAQDRVWGFTSGFGFGV